MKEPKVPFIMKVNQDEASDYRKLYEEASEDLVII